LASKVRQVVFQPEFIDDVKYWVATDRRVARVISLVGAILSDPFKEIGKPEPLKYLVPGAWSRGLTQHYQIG
jgi:toxin YoeB